MNGNGMVIKRLRRIKKVNNGGCMWLKSGKERETAVK
jgi:hypothetical protein